jgi:hypothetical protein
MHKFLSITILLILCVASGFAQRSVQSTVYDAKDNMPLEMVNVRLLNANDSSLVTGAQTDAKGGFMLSRVRPGNYILEISTLGYNKQFRNITMANTDLILRRFSLDESVVRLQGVEVKGTAAQLVVKGDTLEYNATAFKTQENAMVEDLLKKLPGLEINDGKVTVNGEEIKNIRVDGQKFFTGDVEQAIKNLPADMIEKIQVLEQKSDMAQLTGFEDDNTERIINLTTKPNRKKGVFGNAGLGGGVDAAVLGNGIDGGNINGGTFDGDPLSDHLRYDGNLSLSLMTGSAQTRVNAGANNLNVVRSGRGRGRSGGGSSGGITQSQNLGINNNTILNDNLKFGGDITGNHASSFSKTETNQRTDMKGEIYNDTTSSNSKRNMWNSDLRFEAEWKIDSLSTIIFQPRFGYETATTSSNSDRLSNKENVETKSNSENNGTSNSISGGLNLIYNRKFASKKGRSLTMNLSSGFSQDMSESFNKSDRYTHYFDPANPERFDTTRVDQFTENRSNGYNYSLRMSFVEPLWNNRNMIEIAASFSNNTTKSEKDQYKNDGKGSKRENYTELDEEYSNNFENVFYRESFEVNYRYTQQYFNVMLGANLQPSQTRNVRNYGNGYTRDTTYGVVNFSPNGRFQYNFGQKTFARFDYRGRSQQPSLNQMLPVKNNSNTMRETIGNDQLQPSFSHNFRLMYSAFFSKTFASFSTFLSMNLIQNDLVSNNIYDENMKRYSQTVNAKDIPITANWNIMYNTPIISKLLHFNTNTTLGYRTEHSYEGRNVNNSTIDVDNLLLGEINRSTRRSISEQLSLTLTQDIIELVIRGNISYSNSINSLRNEPTNILDWTIRVNPTLRLPYRFTISSDIAYSDRRGYTNMNLNEIMWNANIDKQIMKNRGTISLRANDILRKRLNIRQSIEGNTTSYSRYNTLPAYYLVSFSYQLNQFGGSSRGQNRREVIMGEGGENVIIRERSGEGGENFRRGGGMPGGGGVRVITTPNENF